MEVVLAGVLGVLMDPLLLMTGDFWQRSEKMSFNLDILLKEEKYEAQI